MRFILYVYFYWMLADCDGIFHTKYEMHQHICFVSVKKNLALGRSIEPSMKASMKASLKDVTLHWRVKNPSMKDVTLHWRLHWSVKDFIEGWRIWIPQTSMKPSMKLSLKDLISFYFSLHFHYSETTINFHSTLTHPYTKKYWVFWYLRFPLTSRISVCTWDFLGSFSHTDMIYSS